MSSARLPVDSRGCGLALLAIVLAAGPARAPAAQPTTAEPSALRLRTRVETSPGSGRFHAQVRSESWDPARTAIVVCDMWDRHWCRGATERVAQMAPRMNEVLTAARQ